MSQHADVRPLTSWREVTIISGVSSDPSSNVPLEHVNVLLTWMHAVGRARVIYWDDHLDTEHYWLEILFPLTDGTWATWEEGLDFDDSPFSYVPEFADLQRSGPGQDLSVTQDQRRWPRTSAGWLWIFDSLDEWANGCLLHDQVGEIFDESLMPHSDNSIASSRSGDRVSNQLATGPSPKLCAYAALRSQPTYLGLTRILEVFRYGTNEYAWSPWGPPVDAVAIDHTLAEEIDFNAIAQFMQRCLDSSSEPSSSTTDEARTLVTSLVEPLLIAYPGTPAWLLSEIAERCNQPQLLAKCALVPESLRAQIALTPTSQSSTEVVSHPGDLLGPAVRNASEAPPSDSPLLATIKGLHKKIDDLVSADLSDRSREALAIVVNSPVWAIAIALDDGWMADQGDEVATDLMESLEAVGALLKNIASSSGTLGADDVEEFRKSVRRQWLQFAGVADNDE